MKMKLSLLLCIPLILSQAVFLACEPTSIVANDQEVLIGATLKEGQPALSLVFLHKEKAEPYHLQGKPMLFVLSGVDENGVKAQAIFSQEITIPCTVVIPISELSEFLNGRQEIVIEVGGFSAAVIEILPEGETKMLSY